ncbi:MAG: hypothetical protein V1705_01690 [bacterium]
MSSILDFDIIQFFTSPIYRTLFFVFKYGMMVFSAFLFGIIVFSLLKTTWLKRLILWDAQEFLSYQPHDARKILKDWQRIKKRMDTGLESEFKIAVIEADTMLDDVLKKMGRSGDSLGERLDKLTTDTLGNLAEVRTAHQTRNNIVHDPDYRLSMDEAGKVIQILEKALTDLQAL